MAAELVETSRLWARTVARIEPEWVEPLAAHLVRRSYSEPHWERKRGGAVALEKVTLYGVPIVADRKVSYARIDPAAARELFIRHALVEGDWQTSHQFFGDNAAAGRGRRAWSTGPAAAAWSSARTRCSRSTTRGSRPTWSPPGTSTPGGRRPAGQTPDLLTLKPDDLLAATPTRSHAAPTPRSGPRVRRAQQPCRLSYAFEPGSETTA